MYSSSPLYDIKKETTEYAFSHQPQAHIAHKVAYGISSINIPQFFPTSGCTNPDNTDTKVAFTQTFCHNHYALNSKCDYCGSNESKTSSLFPAFQGVAQAHPQINSKQNTIVNLDRACVRSATYADDRHAQRKKVNALRASLYRSRETSEKREVRRLKDRLRTANRRSRESDEEKKLRRYGDAVRAANRRMAETEEEKRARQMKDRMRKSRKRGAESEGERRARLEKDRVRMATRRMAQKLVKVEDFAETESGLDKKKVVEGVNYASFCSL